MFVAMSSQKDLSPLGLYIDKQLKLRRTPEGKPWSIRELARRSNLSNSGLSVIMRGLSVPDTATIDKIATALDAPVQELLVAAGLEVPPEPTVDRSAAYIARRLSELPVWLQDQAIDATGKLVDAYSSIAENGHSQHSGQENESARFTQSGERSERDELEQLRDELISLMAQANEVMELAIEAERKLMGEKKDDAKSLNERWEELKGKMSQGMRDRAEGKKEVNSSRPKPRDFTLLPQVKPTESPA